MLSHMGKNKGNPDLVCEKKKSVKSLPKAFNCSADTLSSDSSSPRRNSSTTPGSEIIRN